MTKITKQQIVDYWETRVYEGNIGQTATIWVGYYDNYGKQWLDSIKVIIDE